MRGWSRGMEDVNGPGDGVRMNKSTFLRQSAQARGQLDPQDLTSRRLQGDQLLSLSYHCLAALLHASLMACLRVNFSFLHRSIFPLTIWGSARTSLLGSVSRSFRTSVPLCHAESKRAVRCSVLRPWLLANTGHL
uniref:Uncharacterized protein n=1 Tax=Bionectria ochroleuca TaxID=29856 RepID=A0A8H7NNA2_BIOOC